MNVTSSRKSHRVSPGRWSGSAKVGEFEKTTKDGFTRSVLQRFEPEAPLDNAVSDLRSSSFGSFHKTVGFGVGAFWLGMGAAISGYSGSTGLALGLGAASVGAAAIAVKSGLDTGTDFAGYRKVDNAVNGKFKGDKDAAIAFGFVGTVVGGVVANAVGLPTICGFVPGIATGAVGYYYVGELMRELRGQT